MQNLWDTDYKIVIQDLDDARVQRMYMENLSLPQAVIALYSLGITTFTVGARQDPHLIAVGSVVIKLQPELVERYYVDSDGKAKFGEKDDVLEIDTDD